MFAHFWRRNPQAEAHISSGLTATAVGTLLRHTACNAQAVLPPLLCSAAAAAEAHAARAGPGRADSEPHLAHLDDSLRATYALVWAAGAFLQC